MWSYDVACDRGHVKNSVRAGSRETTIIALVNHDYRTPSVTNVTVGCLRMLRSSSASLYLVVEMFEASLVLVRRLVSEMNYWFFNYYRCFKIVPYCCFAVLWKYIRYNSLLFVPQENHAGAASVSQLYGYSHEIAN